MNLSLLQIDDFAEDAALTRAKVLIKGFKDEVGPDGLTYTGICLHEVPHWEAQIAQLLKHEIQMRMSFFRIVRAGEMPHTLIHSDDICAKFAGLLYLTLPNDCAGGTAFWRHRAMQYDALPPAEELAAKHTNVEWFYSMMHREQEDLTWWDQTGFVGMKWNRFITYPTNRFHSRYPFEGFGAEDERARLVWTCFYDIV